jgi:hypothetical protein
MSTIRKSGFLKIVALLLAVSVAAPCYASAAAMEPALPMASYYIDAYNSYVCAMGGGRVEVWFYIDGVNIMDELGALSIQLYESNDQVNWTWVDTFLHEDYPDMLLENDYTHAAGVSYQGVAGRYYKAYVGLWAGRNGGGDTRYMWTPVELAT